MRTREGTASTVDVLGSRRGILEHAPPAASEATLRAERAVAASPRSDARSTLRVSLAVLAGYVLASFVLFGLPVAGRFGSAYVGGPGPDPKLFMWSLAWWPHALTHGLNPFVTHLVWAPSGYSVAWTTAIPGPSVALAPLTWLAGPVVSYNVLALLSPSLGAWTAFLLCRRLTRSVWASIAGGWVFGFSSYELGHLRGQLNLTLVFLVPLIALLVVRAADGTVSRRRFVAGMTALLAGQFLISVEIFASTMTFAAMALLLAAWMQRGTARAALLGVGRLGLRSLAYAVVAISPFLVAMALGPFPAKHFDPRGGSAALANLVIPTSLTRLSGGPLRGVAEAFSGPLAGQGAYLGIPLLAVLAAVALRRRGAVWTRFMAVAFGAVVLVSLGPWLEIVRRPVVPFPWRLAAFVPLVAMELPGRFIVYATLIAAVGVAVWAADRRIGPGVRWGAVALIVVSLLPISASHWVATPRRPAFFTEGLYRTYLPADANVLVIGPGAPGEPMLWQADAGMGFRMAAGYLGAVPRELETSPIAHAAYHGRFPLDVEALLDFARERGVDDLVIGKDAALVEDRMAAFGIAPVRVGGVVLYPLSPQAVDALP